tara:strand:- start:43 stop:1434 length:1392 start_codon:yes stop_codon:yes gene_type:complete
MAEEIPELYRSLKKTEKTKSEFAKEYNEIRQRLIAEGKFKSTDKGLNPAILNEMGEYPYWKRGRSNPGPVPFGEGEFHQMSGGVARPFSARKASQKKSANLRADRLQKANELMIAAGLEDEVKIGKAKFDSGTVEGMAWDHKWEVQDFGSKYEKLIEEFASGSITEEEFKTRLDAHVGRYPGDIDRNLELKEQSDNLKKENATRAKLKEEALADKYAVKDARYHEGMQRLKAVRADTAKLNGIHQFAQYHVMSKANNYTTTTVATPNKRGSGARKNGNGNGNGNGKVNGGNLSYEEFLASKKNGNGILTGIQGKFGGLRTTDQVTNIGVNAATGNYGGAAVGTGLLAGSELLKDAKFQRRMATQVGKLISERGAKSAAKLIPGLDVLISGKETLDYLSRGKLDQAGIAALSGAIGWLPVIGDGISAALDLSNTGLDIARMNYTGNDPKKKKSKLDTPTRRFKI